MDGSDSWRLALLIVCLGLSAFFSASETAFISLPRARLLHLVRSKQPGANRVSQLIQRPERFLATVLLGNNLVNTAAAALAAVLVVKFLDNDSLAVLVSTLGMTLLLLVFGETAPKTIAWHRSERVSFAVARPLSVVGFVLAPAARMVQGVSTLTNRLLGISGVPGHVGEEEIRTLIAAGAQTGTVDATEAGLLEKVFRFGDRQMREVMTPRPGIVWVEQGATLSEFLDIYRVTSHTRFPVFHGSMENVLGVLSVKDVLSAMNGDGSNPQGEVTGFLRPAFFVPETKSVSETFNEMQQGGHSVVLTVDEFGGIAGLATLKQLLEIIVGQVGESGVAPRETVTHLGRNNFRVDAGVAISEINEDLELGLPEGDYQTVAGFMLDRLGRIPDEGDVVKYGDISLTVKTMDGVRIEEVELEQAPTSRTEVRQ